MKTLLILSSLLVLPAPARTAGPALESVVQNPHASDLIRRGRKLLEEGDLDGALELFEQADAEGEGQLATRMWVLRVWFAKGRINDAFDEVDALGGDSKGPDLDYLYGMGSYLKAKKYIEQNVPDSTTGFALQDAQSFLKSALAADPEKYHDAWYPLAEAAWLNQDPTSAAPAAAEAVKRRADADTLYLQARVLFSLYQLAAADEARAEEAGRHLADAIAGFRSAIEKVPEEKAQSGLLADMYKNLGIALQWAEDLPGARDAYARAVSWNPGILPYGDYWNSLGLESFTATLESGAEQFVARWGDENNYDATLQWWLGYAYFSSGQHELSEEAFKKAVAKWPAYVNSWFYVGMSRYHRGDFDGAVEAWHENWKRDPANLVASVQSDRELHLAVFEYVQGKCAEQGQPPQGTKPEYNLKAAFVGEVLCGTAPENWKYWNDYGLFARDSGQFLAFRKRKGDEKEAQLLFEKAWDAYQTAIGLAPDKPHLLNDAAVLLHYYLERDYDEAMKMYERALTMATAQLAEEGLTDEDRIYTQTAKRDAANNMRKLKSKLEGDGEGGGEGESGGQR